MSSRLLDRFARPTFKELTPEEWSEVLLSKLVAKGLHEQAARAASHDMVVVHMAIKATVGAHDFPEVRTAWNSSNMPRQDTGTASQTSAKA